MRIGPIIKAAIDKSGFTVEQIAVDTDMSIANLYRIYKRDSIDSNYLIGLCRKLKIPYSDLLGPEDWLEGSTGGSHTQSASKVKSNMQSISMGGGSADVVRLQYELQMCQVERDGLEKQLRDKDRIIELLERK